MPEEIALILVCLVCSVAVFGGLGTFMYQFYQHMQKEKKKNRNEYAGFMKLFKKIQSGKYTFSFDGVKDNAEWFEIGNKKYSLSLSKKNDYYFGMLREHLIGIVTFNLSFDGKIDRLHFTKSFLSDKESLLFTQELQIVSNAFLQFMKKNETKRHKDESVLFHVEEFPVQIETERDLLISKKVHDIIDSANRLFQFNPDIDFEKKHTLTTLINHRLRSALFHYYEQTSVDQEKHFESLSDALHTIQAKVNELSQQTNELHVREFEKNITLIKK